MNTYPMSLQCLVERDSYTRRTEGTAKGTRNQNTMWKNLRNKRQKLNQEVQKLKHVKTYEKPPPGFINEEYKPEDCIPADPGNEDARDFLAHAPTKGLWMPLGKEVLVMQALWTQDGGPRVSLLHQRKPEAGAFQSGTRRPNVRHDQRKQTE